MDTEYLDGNEDLDLEDISLTQPRLVTSNSGVNIGLGSNPLLSNNYQYKVEPSGKALASKRNSFRILQLKEVPDAQDLAKAKMFADHL